jgi:Flp pilus assembly protein TadD
VRGLSGVQVLALALCLGGCQTLDEALQWKPWNNAQAADVTVAAAPPPAAAPELVAAEADAVVQPTKTLTVQHPAQLKYYRSDEPLRVGMEHFQRGSYGLAEKYFQDAVEKTPGDAIAWASLAASYDRLGRFDLADRAYRQAIRRGGETVQVLNNQGYSYMLRGNLGLARAKFVKALALDPGNPRIINNLRLLDSARVFVDDRDGTPAPLHP